MSRPAARFRDGSDGPSPSSARPAPPPYSDDEQPLNNTVNEPHYGSVPPPSSPRKNARRRPPQSYVIIMRVIVIFMVASSVFVCGLALGYIIQTPLDTLSRQRIREKWAREVKEHEAVQESWEIWVADMKVEQKAWYADRSARQEQDRIDDIERRRAMKAELDKWEEVRRYRQEQDRIDEEERERKKRKASEEHEQQRGEIEWQGLERQACVRYKTADYMATLSHVPLGFDPLEECRNKSMMIHGRDVLPSRCEDEGYCGKMTGHWEIDFGEPSCTPFFVEVQDKGCVGAHRRYDARLENIQEWDTWKLVCSTMSAAYGGVKLGPGASCSECNGGRCGYWATWMIQDHRCVA